MSVLQKLQGLEEAKAMPLPLPDISDNRIVFITSRDILPNERKSLETHGKLIDFSYQLFAQVSSLANIPFTYLIINIRDKQSRDWVSCNVSNMKCKIVIIRSSSELDNEPWIQAIPYNNVIKGIPDINLVKELFEKSMLDRIHIPHPRNSMMDKAIDFFLPQCISGAQIVATKVISQINL